MSVTSRISKIFDKPLHRRQALYEGSEKILFMGAEPNTCVLYFTDHSEAIQQTISGKGAINSRLSEFFMRRMSEVGIANHFLRQMNMREQLVRATEVLPIFVEVYNFATGELAQRLNIPSGTRLLRPVVEIRYKSKELGNPFVSTSHIAALHWAQEDDVEDLLSLVQRSNDFLAGQMMAVGLRLLNFRLEFGRYFGEADFMDDGQIIVIDEISPETFGVALLSDEKVEPLTSSERYQEIAQRFGLLTQEVPHGDDVP